MDRKTLKIKANVDTKVKFLFNDALEGTNDYGVYHLYAFQHNGEEVGLFATNNLHEKLRVYNTGDEVNIVKEEYEPGKFGWIVTPEEGTVMNSTPPNGSSNAPSGGSSSPDQRTKDIHRQVCLKLAVQSMEKSDILDMDTVKLRMEGLLGVLDPEEALF